MTSLRTQELQFAFGDNWRSFLQQLSPEQITEARICLLRSLGQTDLKGVRALDVGSGSGLSSLVLYTAGADVVSFDLDPNSAACTKWVRRDHAVDKNRWQVLRGSVLDEDFMDRLGQFDLVYAWGVLHHTGQMWKAVDLAAARVTAGGNLLLALYNDQGSISRFWKAVKRHYSLNRWSRWQVLAAFYPMFAAYACLDGFRHKQTPWSYAKAYHKHRGMSLRHDWKDWLGGYPFETATPAAVRAHLETQGLSLVNQTLTHGLGCNEFLFHRS